MAFNHGAVGHPASREQRSKISSGAISLESLWSSALLELNLLCHRVRIHSEGQMSNFFFTGSNSKQPEKYSMFAKFHVTEKTSSWSGDVNTHFHFKNQPCFPPFKLRWSLLYLFSQGENGAFSQGTEFPYKMMYRGLLNWGLLFDLCFRSLESHVWDLFRRKGDSFWRSALGSKYEKKGGFGVKVPNPCLKILLATKLSLLWSCLWGCESSVVNQIRWNTSTGTPTHSDA